jgi:hypothetical protein
MIGNQRDSATIQIRAASLESAFAAHRQSQPTPKSVSLTALAPWRLKTAFRLGRKIASLPVHESIWETMTPSAPAEVLRVCGFTIIKRVI